VPTAVGGSLTLARMTLNTLNACGVTTTGKGYCWGEGRVGQIGDGAMAQRLLPSPITAPAN
jgi:alpha-tubulin suppressor-like RCC1 family protein